MLTRGLLFLCACLAAGVLWLRADLVEANAERETLRRAVAVAEAERALAAEARDVAQAHWKRVEREAAEWRGIENDLHGMEGRDAPLSDHLRGVAGRLWP